MSRARKHWLGWAVTLACVVGRRARRGRVQDNGGMRGEHHGDGRASDSGRHHVSHRPSASTAWTRAAFAAIVLLLSLAAPVAAGPFEDAVAADGRGDYVTALRLWRPLADQGSVAAQFNLGIMYAAGEGVPQDYAEAVKWYRLAADQGLANAQQALGRIYHFGKGVPQDHTEAVKWYRLAADQGDATAQYLLGGMYEFGRGVPQNYAEARKWLRLAADQGHASAQYSVGHMYYFGKGVPQDYGEALKWLRLAASQSDADAQGLLGHMHYGDYLSIYGRALERERRREPVDKAEEKRSSQSWAEAYKWYALAADQGHALAQSGLAAMYSSNYVLSHMWYNLAAAQGDQHSAKARDDLEKSMTPAQIAEAQKLAREWQPKRP